ncbi:MAG: hypothetical protein JWR72_2926 [Flavisolibacter sp.]|nr:hypothetical protein [Flavisolibacter sp.]
MLPLFKMLIIPFWAMTFLAIACSKPNDVIAEPVMQYSDLQDAEVKPGQHQHIDIDSNGSTDFTFHTLLVGDPLLQRDRLQYLAASKIGTNLLNNTFDESPRLIKGDRIGLQHEGFTWYELSSIMLAEKLIPLHEDIYWDGIWKAAKHHFLPVEVMKDGHAFLGWIELSFDKTAEKLILHKAAISTKADTEIKAGY